MIASIHYGQNQSRERITQRLISAIQNPHVCAIGHPTGRLIGRRKGYELDFETVLKAAADYGCLLELNSQPSRLDLDDVALMAAKQRGVGIVVNTDAHAVEELSFIEFGVNQARRAGLESGDVVNTRTLLSFASCSTKNGKRNTRARPWRYRVLTIQASGSGHDDDVSLRQEPNRIERLLGRRDRRCMFHGHDDLWHTADGVPPHATAWPRTSLSSAVLPLLYVVQGDERRRQCSLGCRAASLVCGCSHPGPGRSPWRVTYNRSQLSMGL